MSKVSAVLITYNEAGNILRALRSLERLADDIVVVDSCSDDGTPELCRDFGARVYSRAWTGYSSAKNWGNSLARHPWILSIDADEEVSEALRKSLLCHLETPWTPETVFSFNRLTSYCGHWIRHSGWYPDRKIRLWHRDFGQWEGDIHETLVFRGTPQQIHLKGDLLHYSFPSEEDYLRQRAKFAALSAKSMYHNGQKAGLLKLWLSPVVRFLRDYLIRGGLLAGGNGLKICRMNAGAVSMKYRTLRSLHATGRRQHPSD